MKKDNSATWKTGMRRVTAIMVEERRLGYKAIDTGKFSTGVDLLVHGVDMLGGWRLVRVYEVTNYAKRKEYISKKKAERYRRNLVGFEGDLERILVVSFEDNLNKCGGRDYFESVGIKIIVRGEQE